MLSVCKTLRHSTIHLHDWVWGSNNFYICWKCITGGCRGQPPVRCYKEILIRLCKQKLSWQSFYNVSHKCVESLFRGLSLESWFLEVRSEHEKVVLGKICTATLYPDWICWRLLHAVVLTSVTNHMPCFVLCFNLNRTMLNKMNIRLYWIRLAIENMNWFATVY